MTRPDQLPGAASIPEPRYTATGARIPAGHATLICACSPTYTDTACESLRTTPACGFPGCGRPTAYLPGPEEFGWRHVIPDDEASSHVGHPMRRSQDQQDQTEDAR
jgi:hypothetical protein